MIPLTKLKEAAFWEGVVCLLCGETVDGEEEACPDCGGKIYLAADILSALESVEDDSDDE